MFKQIVMAAFAATLSFSTAHAAIIDNFSDASGPIFAPGNEPSNPSSETTALSATSSDFTNVSRTMAIESNTGFWFNSNASIAGGILDVNFAVPTVFTLDYSNTGGFDFLAHGAAPGSNPVFEGFIFDVLEIDHDVDVLYQLSLNDGTGGTAPLIAGDVLLSTSGPGTFSGTVQFDKNLFAAVDLANITDIELRITTSDNNIDADFNFVGYGYIPEPAPLALLGIGLVGMVFTRRRKKA